MILARLEQADRYLCLHPDFAAAIGFLRSQPLSSLPEKRIDISGGMYAMISRSPARPRSEAPLEAHRSFIDIQYLVEGSEEMGWRACSRCHESHSPYDAAKDVEFFADEPDGFVTLRQEEFVIFFPDDAHAPLIGTGEIKKIVIKVLLQC